MPPFWSVTGRLNPAGDVRCASGRCAVAVAFLWLSASGSRCPFECRQRSGNPFSCPDERLSQASRTVAFYGRRLLRDGRCFRRDDKGFYAFVGRADDMFVSGGENLYPGEVETLHGQRIRTSSIPAWFRSMTRSRVRNRSLSSSVMEVLLKKNSGNTYWIGRLRISIRAGCGFWTVFR